MSRMPDHGDFGAPPPRELPRNVEAEQALLGAILINNDAFERVSGFLRPEHFAEEIHQRIFEVTSKMIASGGRADPITLKTYLGDHDLGGITVPAYLAKLAADATTIINAADYGRMVHGLAVRRGLILIGQETVDLGHDAPVDCSPAQIIERTETAFMEMRARDLAHVETTRIEAGDAATELLAEVDAITSGKKVDQGVRIGLPTIDQDTGGLRPGDLWVVAGRASMGKSILATRIALGAARSGAGVVYFPFEIGKRQGVARLLSDLAYSSRHPVGYGQILKGEVDEEARWRLDEAAQRLAALPLVIDGADGATLAQIRARIRSEQDRMARKGVRLGVVVLDYLAFISASNRYQGQRTYEIGEITIALKRMATSLGIGIALLAQVNRQTEQRDDKRPQISDLRDSGSLEQDADVIAFVYRENYYIERSAAYQSKKDEAIIRANETRDEIEVIIGKNRTGATRSHKLWVNVECSAISAQAREGM